MTDCRPGQAVEVVYRPSGQVIHTVAWDPTGMGTRKRRRVARMAPKKDKGAPVSNE